MASALPGRALPIRRGRWPVVLFFGVLLSGCGGGVGGEVQNPARRALAAAARPVLLVLNGNPFDMDQARLNGLVSSEMAAGVTGMSAGFTTSPALAAAPDPRVVLLLNPLTEPAPAALCAAPEAAAPGAAATAPASDRLRIVGAFCDGDQLLGMAREEGAVTGPTDQRFRRLLGRTAGQLFPDEYETTYGFGILPKSFDFGLGGSFGR
jgi:hypothetical protein